MMICMDKSRWNRLRWPLFLAVFILVLVPGCGKVQKTAYKVRGQLFASTGEPATGALVTFQPVKSDPDDPARPTGQVDEAGNYTLTTYTAGDGAPEGEYIITVVWPTPRKTPFEKVGGDQLGGKLDNKEKSTHKFTVEKKPDQVVPPITLP